jgi:elongation factor G
VAKYEPSDLRNVALCGQMACGKTMLAEAMLLKAGAIGRLGRVEEGATASDFDPEEKERQYSVNTTPLHCNWEKTEYNLIDTPGGIDFFGHQIAGLGACDTALICVNAAKGIEVLTRKAWETAEAMGKARFLVITRMDGENVNFGELLGNLQEAFGNRVVPFTLPQGEGPAFETVIDVFGSDVPADLADQVESQRLEITENAVEANDAMMEKYLEQGEISHEELLECLKPAVVAGTLVPLFCVAAEKDAGVEALMRGLTAYAPSPLELPVKARRGTSEEAEEEELTPAADGPLLGQVFKTVSDPHVGKLSMVRLFSGSLEAKGAFKRAGENKAEKAAHLYRYNGEKHEEITGGTAGDIITLAKIDELRTGDSISDDGQLAGPPLVFPKPMVGLAVQPKSRGDEGKIGQALSRLTEEDPTFESEIDPQTHEMVIRGMGQIHLDVQLSRLKQRYNVDVSTKPPKIPYLETISSKAEGHYRHKKQTGGAGQFAEVFVRMEPNERGEGFEFVDAIVGGAISQQFVGSTEKGIVAAMQKGPLAGYPVVDVKVELYDGKEHPVDSKDIAFQTAGRNAFYDAMQKAKPVMLEPIVDMEVVFPSAYTGDINSDISGRRGRPTGMEAMGEMQMVKAQVPLAEVTDYASTLKAITQGEGFFSMEMSHYEPVPSNVAQQVVAKLKAEQEEENEK